LKNDFDAGSDNDLRGFASRYNSNGSSFQFWNMDFNEINVSPNDINITNPTIFNPLPAKSAFNFSDTDWNSKQFFFGFYEYDWYVTNLKGILNTCTNNLNTSIAVRMVYADEWYFTWCGSGSSLMPTSGFNLVGENAKSRFVLQRN
jgi:hypothetical protein